MLTHSCDSIQLARKPQRGIDIGISTLTYKPFTLAVGPYFFKGEYQDGELNYPLSLLLQYVA